MPSLPQLQRAVWRIFAVGLLLVGGLLGAAARAQDGQFLPPDQAFRFTASVQSADTVVLHFAIAKDYYLYQERFHFEPKTPGVQLAQPKFPPAEKIFDPNFGKDVFHYTDQVSIPIRVKQAPASFQLLVSYQGCSTKGLCYPPIDKLATISLTAFGGNGTVSISEAPEEDEAAAPAGAAAGASAAAGAVGQLLAAGKAASATAGAKQPAAAPAVAQGGESSRIGAALASGSLLTIVPMFLVFGLLLAFTPCVLPMIPILSSIIVGQGEKVSRGRGFLLALAYSLGMAIVYTAFGVAAGLLGQGLAATLQNPWVLSVFAALLVLLALSMFGFYELQVPSSWQSKLSSTSDKLQGGHFVGVFIMGGISALIVGPCVAAPLAGALLYISQTGNAVIGGFALFSLAAGMSVPLLLVGLGAGALLPRAGGWMDGVKAFFGVLLIATALYMIAPVLPDWLLMLLWAALLIISATYLRVFDTLPEDASGWRRLFKGVGVVLAIAGAILLVGLAAGSRNLLQPLAGLGGGATAVQTAAPAFQRIKTVAELDHIVATSTKPVMLDFYANWCVSCKEMEHFTFTNPEVAQKMAGLTLLQADVTHNTADDKELLKRFQLFGPPGIIFFKDGKEVGRVVGFEDAKTFLASMQRAGI